jgi:hypothetical protein
MTLRLFPGKPKVPSAPNGTPLGPKWLFLLLTAILVGAIGTVWLAQPVSNQELLANFAKAEDFLAAARSVGGLPWWTPMFLQGTSLAFSWSFIVTNGVLLAFSIPLGFLVGPKVAMMTSIAFGAVGMFVFLRKYTTDDWCAFFGGILFLLSPSLLTRAAGYEHFIVVCSMSLLLIGRPFCGLITFCSIIFARPLARYLTMAAPHTNRLKRQSIIPCLSVRIRGMITTSKSRLDNLFLVSNSHSCESPPLTRSQLEL